MNYKLGSLFDGSGGFPLAGAMCGIEPVWASEVEPYPIAVTKTRFPTMKHLGDISKINGAEIEPVDIITFGSPCQDLSVAGKRAGLKHEANGDEETTRSGLFMEAVRIIKEMRDATNGEYPRYALWENVPGAFSSNKGEDFRIVLEELIKIVEPRAVMPPVPQRGWPYADSYIGNGWSVAYRVFDAQYWGVPQRRRRIHLIADFRGESARKVLFEREGLRGYFAESGTTWKAVAPDAERSIGADDCEGEVPYTLKIRSGVAVDSYGKAAGKGALIQKNLSATLGVSQDQYLFQPVGVDVYNTTVTGDVACPLTAEGHTSTGPCPKVMIPVTVEPGIAAREGGHAYEGVSGTLRANAGDNQMAVAYGISAYESNSMKSSNPHSGIYEADTSRTLDLNGGNPACNQGGIAIVEAVTDRNILDDQGGSQISVRDDGKCPTLRAEMHGNVPCVMETAGFCPETGGNDPSRSISYSPELSPTLRTGATPGVVYGVDAYNQAITGDKAKTLNSAASDADHVPCAVYSVENHPADSRVDIDESGTVQTLTGRMGTGGGNVPMVMELFVKSHRAQTADDATTWKHGKVANTLNTFDQGEARASELVVETVALEGNGQRPSHRGDGYAETDKSYTLNATEIHGVAYGFDPSASRDVGALFIAVDRAFFNQGQNALYDPQTYEDGTNPTLVAKGSNAVAQGINGNVAGTLDASYYKGCGMRQGIEREVVIHPTRYIVRRLTPTECARLQGFADHWGDIELKDTLTEEEYEFWSDVRKTHGFINNKQVKEWTPAQMLTWYNKLSTDSAEYKMWGNGIALPPALYCMQGITEVLNENH